MLSKGLEYGLCRVSMPAPVSTVVTAGRNADGVVSLSINSSSKRQGVNWTAGRKQVGKGSVLQLAMNISIMEDANQACHSPHKQFRKSFTTQPSSLAGCAIECRVNQSCLSTYCLVGNDVL